MWAATVVSVDFAARRGGRESEIGSRSISELRSMARCMRLLSLLDAQEE